MSGPYRGFVELPRAVFEALQQTAEVVLEEAVKAKLPPSVAAAYKPKPRPRPDWRSALVMLAKGTRRDFDVEVEIEPYHDAWRIKARHVCGSWSTMHVMAREVYAAAIHDAMARLARRMDDEIACYCVPRDTTPLQSDLVAAMRALWKAKRQPTRILMGHGWMLALASELRTHEALDGGKFMGVPMVATYGIETFDVECAS